MTRRLQTQSRPSAGRNTQSCSCGNTCQDCRARQNSTLLPHAWTGPVPSLVPEVLASPGAPLESRLRGQMESRFGHDFGKVRVHQDGRAAASAAAVQARAYTVGHQIVLGSAAAGMTGSDTMPLLDHELAHVVQQDRAAGTSHSVGVLQRAGLDEPIVQAPSASASSAPENQAAGLPEPDCNTRVADLFLLGAISCPQRSECCFAQIHDRKNRNLTGIFRADHQLEGRPDCEYGDQNFWAVPSSAVRPARLRVRGPKTPRFLAGESLADCRDHDVGADGDEHVRARGNVGCGRDRHGQGRAGFGYRSGSCALFGVAAAAHCGPYPRHVGQVAQDPLR